MQEEGDDEQADGAGDQALVQRLLAQRGRDLLLGDPLQVDRQRARGAAGWPGPRPIWLVKPPVMSAPPPPTIPSGYCLKSICGTVTSWLSSATAKCWLSVLPPRLTLAPRCAIWPVTFWNADWPVPLKPKVTSGDPDWSVLGCGLVMSVPLSATLSLRTKYSALGLPGLT